MQAGGAVLFQTKILRFDPDSIHVCGLAGNLTNIKLHKRILPSISVLNGGDNKNPPETSFEQFTSPQIVQVSDVGRNACKYDSVASFHFSPQPQRLFVVMHIFRFDWNVFIAEIENPRHEQPDPDADAEEQTISGKKDKNYRDYSNGDEQASFALHGGPLNLADRSVRTFTI